MVLYWSMHDRCSFHSSGMYLKIHSGISCICCIAPALTWESIGTLDLGLLEIELCRTWLTKGLLSAATRGYYEPPWEWFTLCSSDGAEQLIQSHRSYVIAVGKGWLSDSSPRWRSGASCGCPIARPDKGYGSIHPPAMAAVVEGLAPFR